MRLDHLSYACTKDELADVVQRIGSDLGAPFVDGGRHPSFGTRNFILPLANGCYLEVVAPLDHPAADKMPFGRAVSSRAGDGGGWLTWILAVDDLAPVEARLGRSAAAGHRIRPDGVDLHWQQLGVLDVLDDPQLPWFIKWDCAPADHPSAGGSGVAITRVEIKGNPATIAAHADAPFDHLLDDIDVEWVEAEETGIVAVWFDTPHGPVRID